ncbi:Uxu operon transcriptional regulator [Lentibacillus sp. JNUCC-1]|uniref:FadR/GntR family transcriptional regulator n=1 Tax=Lentibacillus sp. JNUCC-1 TaxID=2654513 RepID=UPI0012E71681|nr:FadR/GntR family transcriptional regulator [Lentibacillus sp. JNUCC-1]MUV37224.1 Uxu operon transcriptional regulator [Lentibacillus sp. JNUCC-1]
MALQRASLVDIAIDRIKAHIAEQGLRPGDRYLSEKELTEKLQVSRTVVREALISLQSIGLLAIRRGGGVVISDQNFDVIKEILHHHYDAHGVKLRELVEIRQIIELGALRLMIEKAVAVDFAELRDINQRYYEAIVEHRDTREADREFHQALIRATGNETFYNFSEIIHDYFSITKIDLVQSESALLASHQEHEAIVERLAAGDLAGAQALMTDHLKPITAYIDQLEVDGDDETD